MASFKVMPSTSTPTSDLNSFSSHHLSDDITLIDAAGAISDVWREIECKVDTAPDPMMTLEDFLAKSGAGMEEDEDVKFEAAGAVMMGGVRGKRRGGPILEPLDKAAQQRQKRMIKNRESAARSRERKQAYQVELESLALKLEEENQQLLTEKDERSQERFKQLMEKVVPVVERQRPPRNLRRVRSVQW